MEVTEAMALKSDMETQIHAFIAEKLKAFKAATGAEVSDLKLHTQRAYVTNGSEPLVGWHLEIIVRL